MSRDLLCRSAQACALGALLLILIELGFFGLAEPHGLLGDSLIVVVALLLGAGLAALRQVTAPEAAVPVDHAAGGYGLIDDHARHEIARTVVFALVFLAIIYHLASIVPAFKPICITVDELLPRWSYDLLMLVPALALLVLAEMGRRKPVRKRARR